MNQGMNESLLSSQSKYNLTNRISARRRVSEIILQSILTKRVLSNIYTYIHTTMWCVMYVYNSILIRDLMYIYM